MPGPFVTLAERGDRWPENRRMHVTLYPNEPADAPACRPGSPVLAAIEDAADQLYDADAVSYYRLARFTPERDAHSYPRLAMDQLHNQFEDYLEGTEEFSDASWCAGGESGDAGCGDLRRYRGVHLLVHGHGLGTRLANAASVDCEHNGGTAFSRGTAAWTGAGPRLRDGLVRNSAIQETVHEFVRAGYEPVTGMICDANGNGEREPYEEHTLGRITTRGSVTPMLTYHVHEHRGCRYPEREWDGSYTQRLTDRTKRAVALTARNQCRPQPGVSERPE